MNIKLIRFSKNVKRSYPNEQGMVLITAMLILTTLTLLGVAAMTNTTIDTMISGNGYMANQRFYAVEGVEEIVISALPDLISGTVTDGGGDPITKLDQLLGYDNGNEDAYPVGDITPLINEYLNSEDFFNDYSSPDSFTDAYTYSVRILDDQDEKKSVGNDPLKDVNNKVNIVSYKFKVDQGRRTEIDLISYQVQLLLINYNGAVNIIDDNTGIKMEPGALISGRDKSKAGDKEGVVTTDVTSDYSEIFSQVLPDGVQQGFDQLIEPGIRELRDVVDSLTDKVELSGAGEAITLGTKDSNDVKVGGENQEIIYLQGDITITDSMENKILIIQDFKDSSGEYGGLTLPEGVEFRGMIILLPRHDFSDAITITLEDGAEIEGVLIASSQPDPSVYNPDNSLYGSEILLFLGNNAKIQYDSDSIFNTGFERQFAVLKRTYRP